MKGVKVGRRWAIVTAGAILVAVLLLAPIVPMKNVGQALVTVASGKPEDAMASSAYDNSSVVDCYPPSSGHPGCLAVSDPSGEYYMKAFPNGTWEIELTSYEKLLQDPYSAICNGTASIVGGMVYLTCPASSLIGGTLSSYPTSTQPISGLGSISYTLFGFGLVSVDSHYQFLWSSG